MNQDFDNHKIYVRGGEWHVTISNDSENECSIELWLAFIVNGAKYKSLDGYVEDPWHPIISGKRFNDVMKLTKWNRNFILAPKTSKKFRFKIGTFAVDVGEWHIMKKGWPVLYSLANAANPIYESKLAFHMSFNITFTEGKHNSFGYNREEMSTLKFGMQLLHFQLRFRKLGLQGWCY